MRNLTMGLLLASSLGLGGTAVMAQDGQAVFNTNCRQCHSVKEGDNRLGPSLAGIVGKKSGQSKGFGGYSSGLKDGSITWDEATLNKWIEDPKALVPSTNMQPYPGIKDEAQRKTIIAYLAASGGGGGGGEEKPAGGQPAPAAGEKPAAPAAPAPAAPAPAAPAQPAPAKPAPAPAPAQ